MRHIENLPRFLVFPSCSLSFRIILFFKNEANQNHWLVYKRFIPLLPNVFLKM